MKDELEAKNLKSVENGYFYCSFPKRDRSNNPAYEDDPSLIG